MGKANHQRTKIKPAFDSKVNLEDSKLNSLRLGVPLFAVNRNTPCFRCLKTASLYHVLIKCNYFTKTRTELESSLLRDGKKLNIRNILDFDTSKTTTNIRNTLIKEIDELFYI